MTILHHYVMCNFHKNIHRTGVSEWMLDPVHILTTSTVLYLYRDEINSLQIQLSRTQAGPDRAVKEQQEQNSPNHVQRINLISVLTSA